MKELKCNHEGQLTDLEGKVVRAIPVGAPIALVHLIPDDGSWIEMVGFRRSIGELKPSNADAYTAGKIVRTIYSDYGYTVCTKAVQYWRLK